MSAEWISWAGGECPTLPDTRVDVVLENGVEYAAERAGAFDWNTPGGGRITKFRLSRRAATRTPGTHTGETTLPLPPAFSAPDLLAAACEHMGQRAATYDKPEGERSMGRAVEAFNAIAGRDLEESEGWLLLQVLKDVRDRQRRDPHRDSLEDCIAYAALKAEARLAGR